MRDKINIKDIFISITIIMLFIFGFILIHNIEKQNKIMNNILTLENYKPVETIEQKEEIIYEKKIIYTENPQDVLIIPSKSEVSKVISKYYEKYSDKKIIKKVKKINHNIYKANIDTVVEHIQKTENFKSHAYRDGCLVKAKKCPENKKRYSIGYGTLAKSKHEKITKEEANKRLHEHIKKVIYPKIKNVKFTSKYQMYSAIDFAYNVGQNALVSNIINDNNEIECHKMTQYVYFQNKYNDGLAKRRYENLIMCLSEGVEND